MALLETSDRLTSERIEKPARAEMDTPRVPMYTDYFGFSEPPFNITPNPRFFYENPIYQEAFAALLYGIRARKGFIVLTGEVGTGKTTLLRRLAKAVEPTIHVAYFYNTTLTFDELLDSVCEDFDLPVVQNGRRLEKIQTLNSFLLTRQQEGGVGVLLIDEAQNLSEEILENLRLLSNLETANEKLLQIVLVGQPELSHKLAQPQLRQLKQRIAIQCQLDRLKEREVGPFIDYRLRTAGYHDHGLFPPEAIQRIAVYSQGIPRLINIICENALLIAWGTAQRTVSPATIEEVARDLQLQASPVSSDRPAIQGETVQPAAMHERQPLDEQTESFGASPARPNRLLFANSSRLLRIGAGLFFMLLLFGGTGAAIYPQHTIGHLSALSSTIEDWFKRSGGAPVQEKGHVPETAQETAASQHPPQDSQQDSQQNSQQDSSLEEEQQIHQQARPALETEVSGPQPERATQQREVSLLPEKHEEEAQSSVQTPQPSSSDSTWRQQARSLQPGNTLSGMALEMYGSHSMLGLDLIKEFNPHLEDLDRIRAGEAIVFPPLTQETLVRQQADGSYRLILASFHKQSEAEKLLRDVRQKGYTADIAPRQVARSLSVYRVEIEGLPDHAAVSRARDLFNTP